jgi:hypothetical protein
LFQREKWISAFAEMTLRSLTAGSIFDFFTRSFTVPAAWRYGAQANTICPLMRSQQSAAVLRWKLLKVRALKSAATSAYRAGAANISEKCA